MGVRILSTFKEIFIEHRTYKSQILKMAKNDLIKTYSGSALGWAWAVIRPVVTIFIYWFAMSVGFKKNGLVNGYPYFLWLITGLVPWFYMSDMLTQGTDCMRKYRYLITKMRYPVSTIPTFVSMSKMVVSLILMVIVVIIYAILGFFPTIYYLQIFFFIFLTFAFFTSWALFAAPISAISQDFSNLIRSFVFAVLWCSGIFWDSTEVGGTIGIILKANPVTYLVTGFRASFMGQYWFWEHPRQFLVFVLELILMYCLGLWSYKKLRKEIPDVL